MASVFNTPVLSACLRGCARLVLQVSGWKMEFSNPPSPPYVFIGAPHTSNWDFVLLLLVVLDLGLDAKWLGKHTLFRFPFGPLMRWLGGIPVNRTLNNNLVATMTEAFARTPALALCIPPEGTRGKVQRWRSGFYHIALEAGVPILMTVLDAEHKTLRMLGVYRPRGLDIAREIREIQQQYRGYRGLRPENTYIIPDSEPPGS